MMDTTYAYAMGFEAAAKGADTTNCSFRIFATPELKRAWELGNAAGKDVAALKADRG